MDHLLQMDYLLVQAVNPKLVDHLLRMDYLPYRRSTQSSWIISCKWIISRTGGQPKARGSSPTNGLSPVKAVNPKLVDYLLQMDYLPYRRSTQSSWIISCKWIISRTGGQPKARGSSPANGLSLGTGGQPKAHGSSPANGLSPVKAVNPKLPDYLLQMDYLPYRRSTQSSWIISCKWIISRTGGQPKARGSSPANGLSTVQAVNPKLVDYLLQMDLSPGTGGQPKARGLSPANGLSPVQAVNPKLMDHLLQMDYLPYRRSTQSSWIISCKWIISWYRRSTQSSWIISYKWIISRTGGQPKAHGSSPANGLSPGTGGQPKAHGSSPANGLSPVQAVNPKLVDHLLQMDYLPYRRSTQSSWFISCKWIISRTGGQPKARGSSPANGLSPVQTVNSKLVDHLLQLDYLPYRRSTQSSWFISCKWIISRTGGQPKAHGSAPTNGLSPVQALNPLLQMDYLPYRRSTQSSWVSSWYRRTNRSIIFPPSSV